MPKVIRRNPNGTLRTRRRRMREAIFVRRLRLGEHARGALVLHLARRVCVTGLASFDIASREVAHADVFFVIAWKKGMRDRMASERCEHLTYRR